MGNCLNNKQPDHKKKSTAEIAPSDFIKRHAATGESPPSSDSSTVKRGGARPGEGPPSSHSSAVKHGGAQPGEGTPSSYSSAVKRGGGVDGASSASASKRRSPPPAVLLYGHPTSSLMYYLRYAFQQKPVSLKFYPTIFELSLFTLEFGKDDVVSGSAEEMLWLMDTRFPEPPLMAAVGKAATTPFSPTLRRMAELQHRSMTWHLERLVRWAADLAARGGKAAVEDPSVGTPRMEVRKFGKSYGQLLDVMLEHAQMEEKVVFPILLAADRGLCKTANEEHARDLPIMNGIKEALKSIVVLDAGTSDHREALYNLSSRLEILQENCRDHFEEEQLNVLPLLGAAELSKEQQTKVWNSA